MNSKWEMPTVDLSPYTAGAAPAPARAAVAGAIDRACSGVGFVQVTGHGIPERTIAGLARAIDSFFCLSSGQKGRYRAPAKVNRGYSPPRSESLSLSLGVEPKAGDFDLFEAFNVGVAASGLPDLDLPVEHYPENIWPGELPGFRSAVEEYFVEAGRVARVLTRIFADALDLSSEFFEPFTDHSVDVMRLNNYALPADTLLAGEVRGMGEHTDYGVVTVLWADPIPGLQVLGADQVWHDVIPRSDALLVNLGDLTARWTNDRWLSTLHRVLPPVVDGKLVRRRSAAYFHDGNFDALIETLPTCRAADGTSAYGPTTVGQHLAEKLAGSRGGTVNTAAEREAARLGALGHTRHP